MDSSPALTRRDVLRLGTAGVLAAGLFSQTGAGRSTVDVTDAGADNTGVEPIDDILRDVAQAHTTVYFPPGRYRLANEFYRWANGLHLIGDNATIISVSGGHRALHIGGIGTVVKGFVIDQRETIAPFTIRMSGGGDWLVEDIHYVGKADEPAGEKGYSYLRPYVNDADRTGTIRNVTLPDGCTDPDSGSNTKAIWAGPNIEGTLHIDQMWVEGFAENTMYLSNIPGTLLIENSYVRNSNVGIRVGGNSTVRNCVIVHDGPVPAQKWSGGRYQRGIWLNGNKQYGYDGTVRIEGCDFYWVYDDQCGSPIHADDRGPVENLVIEDCRIHNTTRRPSLLIEDQTLTLRNVRVSGDSRMAVLNNVDTRLFNTRTATSPVTRGRPQFSLPDSR